MSSDPALRWLGAVADMGFASLPRWEGTAEGWWAAGREVSEVDLHWRAEKQVLEEWKCWPLPNLSVFRPWNDPSSLSFLVL